MSESTSGPSGTGETSTAGAAGRASAGADKPDEAGHSVTTREGSAALSSDEPRSSEDGESNGRGASADVPGSGRSLPAPGAIVVLTWILGAIAMGAALVAGLLRAASARKSATPLHGDQWESSVETAHATVRLQERVPVLRSSRVATAMAGGIISPFILLPDNANTWSTERRQVVLLHELIHVRRRDALRQVLARAALCLYWFHPVVWLANRLATLAREQACDEEVLRLGERPSAYARHLLELSERQSLPLPALSIVDHQQLEKRIMRILSFKPRRTSRLPVAAVFLLIGAGGVAVAAATPATTTPVGDADQPNEVEVSIPVAVDPQAPAVDVEVDVPVTAEPKSSGANSELALDQLLSLLRVKPPADECLQQNLATSASTSTSTSGRSAVLQRDDLRVCLWIQNEAAYAGRVTTLDELAASGPAVLATLGSTGYRRLEISTGAAGPVFAHTVNGVHQPLDSSARSWASAVLQVGFAQMAMQDIRAGDADAAASRAEAVRALQAAAQQRDTLVWRLRGSELTQEQTTQELVGALARQAQEDGELARLRTENGQTTRAWELNAEVAGLQREAQVEGALRMEGRTLSSELSGEVARLRSEVQEAATRADDARIAEIMEQIEPAIRQLKAY